MKDLASEIDSLFIDNDALVDCDEIELITNYISESKNSISELNINQDQINRYINIFQFYKLKLETLSRELCDIEEKNINLDFNIINQNKLYNEIKGLLKSTEISEEHFENLANPNFDDLASIRVSLHIIKKIECDYELKAVVDLKHKVKHTLKEFMRKFNIYLQKELNQLETESRGELLIHGHVYKVIKQYEFIIEYSKECDKDNFILISQRYIKMAKKLYESELEGHLDFVLHSLRDAKSKLKEKMESVFGFIFESLLLIFTSEDDFLRNYFYDDNKFLNDATLTIFSDVIELVFDFIKDSHRINNPLTISAIHKNKEIDVEYNIKHLDIYIRFKNKINEILCKYEKHYFDQILASWGYESKHRLISLIILDLRNNENKNMRIKLINVLVDKILDHKKDSKRGKVEFEIYRSKLLFMLESMKSEENRTKLENSINLVAEIFEKEVITYIFSVEQKKMPTRITNILKVIRDYFHDDQNGRIKMMNMVKAIVFDHVTQEFKNEIKNLFNY